MLTVMYHSFLSQQVGPSAQNDHPTTVTTFAFNTKKSLPTKVYMAELQKEAPQTIPST